MRELRSQRLIIDRAYVLGAALSAPLQDRL